MGYATCRNCNGSGRFYDRKSGKTFDCRACNGSGQQIVDDVVIKLLTKLEQILRSFVRTVVILNSQKPVHK